MRRVLLVTSVVYLFLFVLVSSSKAQDSPTYDKSYQDYVFVSDVYNRSHADYLLARSQFLQAGTLVSRTQAIEATVNMLEARDDVVTTYLNTLRLRLAETEGISNATKEGLFTRIDAEVSWFADHRSRVSSAGTLSDLVEDSDEASTHFFGFTESLILEVLSDIPLGRLSILRTEINRNLFEAKAKTAEIRANGDHDTTSTERWILEVENKITRSLDKEIAAQGEVANLQQAKNTDRRARGTRQEFYTNVTSLAGEALQFMKEANSNMKEIVRSLRVAN